MTRFGAHKKQQGQALIITLLIFTFMMTMIGAAIRANATRRSELKLIQDRMTALNLAESGLQEVIHAIAAGKGPALLERDVDMGRLEVTCMPREGQPGLYDIASTGISRTTVPGCPRRTVRARIRINEGQAQILFRQMD